ncbi:MAG: hypothetical protein K0S74_818 [Chlamydiales bacterium]|jgi:DNA-binding transcriptional LysR family regulator|nr:hypothetical protein [Chlamydiales bacterium]
MNLPDLNLIHLKYFHDAALLNSISAAARENYVSQSAVSQAISKIEQALNVVLTTHQRQSFQLTEEGILVLQGVKDIFTQITKLKNSIEDQAGKIGGEVHLVCTNALAQYFLAPAYAKIRNQLPSVNLKFSRGNLHFIHDCLRNSKIDFALAIDSPEFACYEKRILFKGYFRLYKAKQLENDQGGILIDHYQSKEVQLFRKYYFDHYGEELKIHDALSGWAMVATFVQSGGGIGLLPDFIFNANPSIEEVNYGIPLIEYEICAFNLKGAVLRRATKAVIEGLTGFTMLNAV